MMAQVYNRVDYEKREQELASLPTEEQHKILDELTVKNWSERYNIASWIEFVPKEKENPLWWKRYHIHMLRHNRHTVYHITLATGYSSSGSHYNLHATELSRRHISQRHFRIEFGD
jgi:hypothetical protein